MLNSSTAAADKFCFLMERKKSGERPSFFRYTTKELDSIILSNNDCVQ